MIVDTQSTIDLIKLRFYNEWLYNSHIYDEGESPFHKSITETVVRDYVLPLNLHLDSRILDLGCGPGYFMDEMKKHGYSNVTGVTLSKSDIDLCVSKGHQVKPYDLSFIPEPDESVDFIFLRHALEHSPYPIISLIEYNRLLAQNGKIYIEVPQPNCERNHEFNLNHYSIMGEKQLVALLERTGFGVNSVIDFQFKLDTTPVVTEKYYIIIATKVAPLDIK